MESTAIDLASSWQKAVRAVIVGFGWFQEALWQLPTSYGGPPDLEWKLTRRTEGQLTPAITCPQETSAQIIRWAHSSLGTGQVYCVVRQKTTAYSKNIFASIACKPWLGNEKSLSRTIG